MGHGKRSFLLQSLGSTLSPHKRCSKSKRPNGVQSQISPPASNLSSPTGKTLFHHHAVFIPCIANNGSGTTTKDEPFPPLAAVQHNRESIQAPSILGSDHSAAISKPRAPTKLETRPSRFQPQSLQVVQKVGHLPLRNTARSSSGEPRKLMDSYYRNGTLLEKQRLPDEVQDPHDFEYHLKKDFPSDLKTQFRYFGVHKRETIMDKRSSKRLWTQEVINEGVNLYHWQLTDEQKIQDVVHRNFKGRLLVRKKDQALKHLMEEKFFGTSTETYMHPKTKTRHKHRKSRRRSQTTETNADVQEDQRPHQQWNIHPRHHFRSFDHRQLRRKPTVFDFIFEKIKPCFKDARTKSDSVSTEHFGTDEQDAERDVYVTEDVRENFDAKIHLHRLPEQSMQLVDVLTDATVPVKQAVVNVTAIETNIISEANMVLPVAALIHSEEGLISVQNDGNFVDPSAVQRDQVIEYAEQPTHLWNNLESSSVLAKNAVSRIPVNHNVSPHLIGKQTPKVPKRKQSRTGFDIYQDTNKIVESHSRIPVSISRNESLLVRPGILMDKQNVKLDLTKTKKNHMYSKIPVAVVPCPAAYPKTRSLSNQENGKRTSSRSEEAKAPLKTKTLRTADQQKRKIPQRVFLQREN